MAKRSKNINMFLMDGEVTGKNQMYFVKLDGSDLQNISYSVGRFEVA